MLRGQASLQELIGRSFMNRKRPKNKKKPESTEAPADNGNQAVKLGAASRPSSPLPDQVSCPVCGEPVLERLMNGHLGELKQLSDSAH